MDPIMVAVLVPLGFFATVAIVVIGRPMIKARAQQIENESKRPQVPSEVMSRLERIEQAVDAIAVEVERISEGQRFTTKLLSEPRDKALPGPSAAGDSPRT